jgi:hypothetical protein
MKGKSDELVERAILQCRREADFLYLLLISANTRVLGDWEQRDHECLGLFGWMNAEAHGNPTKERMEGLRHMITVFISSVMVLDAAIDEVILEYFNGQPVLFCESAEKLAEQLQMVADLATGFNLIAVEVGVPEIDLDQVRKTLQPETERTVSIWLNLAKITMLDLFGTTGETETEIERVRIFSGKDGLERSP